VNDLAAEGLVKSYRRRRVVDRVSLTIDRGEVVGLLGPNGAGKTTTFYILVGLIHPDAGHVKLEGEDVTAVPCPGGPDTGVSVPQPRSRRRTRRSHV
jgi:lipopolysaccharide export system ATP-binding protein